MEITVKRNPSAQGATLGEMSIDGMFECYTLEPVTREPNPEWTQRIYPNMADYVASWKIPNVTAIPRGCYQIIVDFSNHFGRDLPHICGVPGFEGVRIHPGNKAADTEGCTLVGQTKEGNLVFKSKAAFDILFAKIQAALAAGQEVWYTVT